MTYALAERDFSRAAPFAAHDAGEKALLRFITCGSVDDGKSTLIGRMLYDSQMIAEDQLAALDRDSKKFGTQNGALDFALLVDGLAAEREQGITIDVAYRYFRTDKRSFIVADTPGHEQYTRNMATGASTADLAIILIDARKGILPQTRRHAFIVAMLGVRDVALAINKMDLVDYSEARFNAIASDFRDMARDLGFRSTAPLPISALNGDNIATLSERTPWFQGEALLPFLENIETTGPQAAEAPFRFPVQWVNRPNLDFRGFSGSVASGAVKIGDEIASMPSGKTSRVQRIVTQDGDLDMAIAGQSVTLTLAEEIDASRGDVLVGTDERPEIALEARARLLWTAETDMHPGASYIIKLGARTANAAIAKLHHLVDIHTFEPEPARPLGLNEIALATLRFDRPMILGDYRDNRDLGGFILIDRITNETVAFGLIDPRPAPEAEEVAPAPATETADWPRLRRRLRTRLAPALFSGLCVGLGAVLLGASPATGVILGLADAALRPLARRLCADYRLNRARRAASRSEETLGDGGGI
ncbi:sulfate adenylyltransferase subunit CysN [Rhodoblastus acidophilus]|uniref:Sulfate adenylyltransferase subunit 1 n=1 Tax=Candidatus Rhodoblastus alkanivorans TaxID=2954117 RepID=A0ABS9Z9R2_9HYPH|nr:sulfate adenylyltransferase subunit CysN [Candidatus Rhodoblastus alkanivorans]MCI4678905.1 sulfate adenylyltransferase subunit CysN [Candidatus Rhodoblastus alkanivorans]MCI4684171.1 sulfate adenylyltransferase subunit CysN [Candidatus Rhodoblastus alkanivorans]MDI4641492.1 sulfate adenylyltransferase subunit CysN [Rhodoblastus acidophilus]